MTEEVVGGTQGWWCYFRSPGLCEPSRAHTRHSHAHKYTNTYLQTHKHCFYYGYVRVGLVKTMTSRRRYFSWNTNFLDPLRERETERMEEKERIFPFIPNIPTKVKEDNDNMKFAGPIHLYLQMLAPAVMLCVVSHQTSHAGGNCFCFYCFYSHYPHSAQRTRITKT